MAEPSAVRGRFNTSRLTTPSFDRRAGLGEVADVINLPDAISDHSRDEWLARFGSLAQLELAFEDQDKVLWCFMNPRGRPCFTLDLAREIRELQRGIRQLFGEQPAGAETPFRYMVWASKVPGIFNLGGDLQFFVELIRKGDSELLLEYATTCVDTVHLNSVNFDVPLITVSLVRGDALGGGFEAALSSNLIIAERSAKFGFPEMLFNLFPGMGAYSLIARRIGAAQAERMILSGRIYGADELYELGLVDVLADDGKGDEAVYEYVDQFGRRHAAHRAVYNVRRRVNPVSYE
ncbi:MAG: crotonase/enoyl-CoA hydratase family protein, partial [Alphaproteobacteria bacterium]